MSDNYLRARGTRKKDIIFCVTCLSTSYVRKMYLVDDISFFSSITLIQMPSNSVFKVCWECKAIFDKIKMFRRRALSANYLMRKKSKNIIYTPLTNLVEKKLDSWVSISCVPLHDTSLEITPQTLDNPLSETTHSMTSVKKEVIENETVSCNQQDKYLNVVDPFTKQVAVENKTLSSNKQEPYLTAVDPFTKEVIIGNEDLTSNKQNSHLIGEGPFSLHSEVDIKFEGPIEDDALHLDIVNCEYDSSSEDEPLINSFKAKSHHDIETHQKDDSETDSATEIPPSPPRVTTNRLPSPLQISATTNIAKMPKSPLILHKDTSSLKYTVQFHTGPQLFKNSPQLAIPEMFRNIEQPKQTTYKIGRLTHKEVHEYRAGRIKKAKIRHWKLFCVMCLDNFAKPHEYEGHFRKHDETSFPFVCNICKLRYPSQKELDEHKEMHFRKYVCDECEEDLFTMKSLVRHHYLVHEDVLKVCSHCGMKFTNKKEYYMHNRTHIQMVNCKQCNKKLQRVSLPRHIRECHGPNELLKCKICYKVLKGKRKLRGHMTNIHSPQEDSGYCVECKSSARVAHLRNTMRPRAKEDIFKSCLEQHINSHQNIRPYQCEQCGATFSYSGARYTHIRVKHRNKEDES